MTHEEIFNKLKMILVKTFDIDENDITLEANLYTDLDLDSIDAIDLAVKMKEFTGKQLTPEQFKSVRTVAQVVTVLETLINS